MEHKESMQLCLHVYRDHIFTSMDLFIVNVYIAHIDSLSWNFLHVYVYC